MLDGISLLLGGKAELIMAISCSIVVSCSVSERTRSHVMALTFSTSDAAATLSSLWDEETCYQWDRAGVGWMVNDDVDC